MSGKKPDIFLREQVESMRHLSIYHLIHPQMTESIGKRLNGRAESMMFSLVSPIHLRVRRNGSPDENNVFFAQLFLLL